MEKTLLAVFENGLTPGLAFTLLQLLVVLFVVLSVRNWMSNFVLRRLAYKRIRAYRHLTEGCWVRLPTSTGAVDGQIKKITIEKVVIETDNTFEHVPILQFDGGRKSILKAAPPKKEN